MGNQCSSNVLCQTISNDEAASNRIQPLSNTGVLQNVNTEERIAMNEPLGSSHSLNEDLGSRASSWLMELCQQQSPPMDNILACVEVLPEYLQNGLYLAAAIQNWTNVDAVSLLIPKDSQNRQRVLLTPCAESGLIPLHLACYKGNENAAMYLLNLFPQATQFVTPIKKQTALALACMRHSSQTLIRELLSVFPKAASMFDNEGMFPMDFYARLPQANHETLRLLSESVFGHGTCNYANPTLPPSALWIEDISAALTSAIRSNTTLAEIRKVRMFHNQEMKPIAERILSTLDDSGHSPLHVAIQMGGRLDVAQYILQIYPKGAEQLTRVSGRTALSLACEHDGVRNNFILLLLSLYPEAVATPCANGMYPLQYACSCGANSRVVSALARDDVCMEIVELGQADLLVQSAIDSGCSHTAVSLLAEKFFRLQPAKVSIRECCICLEPLETGVSRTRCGHDFHTACIAGVTSSSGCPLCRSPMIEADLCHVR